MSADINENRDIQNGVSECKEEKEKIVQEKKEMRGGIFRRVSAMYHEVVNSDSRLFPEKL